MRLAMVGLPHHTDGLDADDSGEENLLASESFWEGYIRQGVSCPPWVNRLEQEGESWSRVCPSLSDA